MATPMPMKRKHAFARRSCHKSLLGSVGSSIRTAAGEVAAGANTAA
jgi:hypothetical protein